MARLAPAGEPPPLAAERVRHNLDAVLAEIAAAAARAGRDPAAVEVLAATKYVAAREMPALAQAGVRLVGENRAQDMAAKVALHGDLFTWDFIGALQSRRVRLLPSRVRLIHSVASHSALRALERLQAQTGAAPAILIEVNVAGEEGKAGIAPEELDEYLERARVPVEGLMTMPPATREAERSRPWFAALRGLAAAHGLPRLSMGTSQDYRVAVEEGATIVRIGTSFFGEARAAVIS
jgi:PLP dependent protein